MRITDPRAVRALAHPLRLDLIEALAVLGPATAARCGRHLGVSQASCSFHLRQLARYGFVEEAPPGVDRRERTWRLTDLEQSWSSTGPDPVVDQLDRVFVQREADRMLDWIGRDDEPADWRDAAFAGGATVPITAAELRELRGQLRAVLEPYVRRLADPADRPAGARFVRVLLAGTPGRDAQEARTPGPDAEKARTPGPDAQEARTPGPDAQEARTPGPDAQEARTPDPDAGEPGPHSREPDTGEPKTRQPNTGTAGAHRTEGADDGDD